MHSSEYINVTLDYYFMYGNSALFVHGDGKCLQSIVIVIITGIRIIIITSILLLPTILIEIIIYFKLFFLSRFMSA